MEQNRDWRVFNQIFYSTPSQRAYQKGSPSSALYFVVNEGRIVGSFSSDLDLSEWNGFSVQEVQDHFDRREVHFFEKKKVDRWIRESVTKGAFFEQVKFLKEQANQELEDDVRSFSHAHFVLEAIEGWWKKILPSHYGIFIQTRRDQPEARGMQERSLILLVRHGEVDGFYHVDFKHVLKSVRDSLGDHFDFSSKDRVMSEVMKYLSQLYRVPVQGLFIKESDWLQASQARDPWKHLAGLLKKQSAQLVPPRWNVRSMLCSRAVLNL